MWSKDINDIDDDSLWDLDAVWDRGKSEEIGHRPKEGLMEIIKVWIPTRKSYNQWKKLNILAREYVKKYRGSCCFQQKLLLWLDLCEAWGSQEKEGKLG